MGRKLSDIIDPMECTKCGSRLRHEDDFNLNKNKMFKRCKRCRDSEVQKKRDQAYYQIKSMERRSESFRKKQEEEWMRSGDRCVRCGGALRGVNNMWKICGRCQYADEQKEKKQKKVVEHMHAQCYSCPFARFNRDFYSCMTAYGTGLDTHDCLRYTAGKTLRKRIIIEECDTDE